jgi:hypothetical protein
MGSQVTSGHRSSSAHSSPVVMLAGVKLSSNPYIVFTCGYIAKRIETKKKEWRRKRKGLPLFLHMHASEEGAWRLPS